MLIIPAIDLKNGRCVRLRQGRMHDVTVFSDDPVAMAQRWIEAGCRRLHLVDLDGAVAGTPRNEGIIRRVAALSATVPVQVGGGIRDIATIQGYLDVGVTAVIVGTRAVEEPAFLVEASERFPGRVFLGLDARGDRIAVRGWQSSSERSLVDFAVWASALPLAGIVYTDIERDGMSTGLNVAATIELAERVSVPVVASGGVGTLNDIEMLCTAETASRARLFGVIIGRALYEGTLDLATAQRIVDRNLGRSETFS